MRGLVYDRLMLATTSRWYRAVLARLPEHATVLDVGVGTGGALFGQRALIEGRDLHITGIDIDHDYVRRALRRLWRMRMTEHVEVLEEDLAQHQGSYDAIYFAASFMLFPDPAGALAHARRLLKPGGSIWFTQTFQERVSPVLEHLKPRLRRVTGIDFGRVTYAGDFFAALANAGLQVTVHEVLRGGRWFSSRVIGATWPVAEVGANPPEPIRV